MMTVVMEPATATLERAIERLRLRPADVDHRFGLVELDPEENLYVVRVLNSAAERADTAAAGTGGPFSDPPIVPFD